MRMTTCAKTMSCSACGDATGCGGGVVIAAAEAGLGGGGVAASAVAAGSNTLHHCQTQPHRYTFRCLLYCLRLVAFRRSSGSVRAS